MPLNSTADINAYVNFVNNQGAGMVNPQVFYTTQLLDTIRMDADQYVYYALADSAPIQEKADKLLIRRWSPLQAHTTPLVEGVPPKSDKGSVEKYEITANQYGRYMEFTDKVDFKVVDPIIAHYTKEYSLVALETLDLLARETLLSIANKYFAGMVADLTNLTTTSKPTIADLRMIVLSLQKQLVKPRMNGKYTVICSPDFCYDMIDDTTVDKYMRINQSTGNLFDSVAAPLPDMFGMTFVNTLNVPSTGEFINSSSKRCLRVYRYNSTTTAYEYATLTEDSVVGSTTTKVLTVSGGYVKDARTGQDASYFPEKAVWDLTAYNNALSDTEKAKGTWSEFKMQHILIVGKDALLRTGLSGEDQAKVYTKEKGSTGVLDPIDQRQSIGFKINSVGFGSTRLEAVVDYICVPSQTNLI